MKPVSAPEVRTVHAFSTYMEVVRYNRAGKWFLEPKDKDLPRQKVSVDQAATYARWAFHNDGACIQIGLPGGRTFDRLVTS